MSSRLGYILLQTFLMLVSPICSFVVSLRFYKNELTQIFFIVFAFYFGFFCGHFHDLDVHYYEFMQYYVGHSLLDILNNPLTFSHGHEPYHFILKYIVSRFTTSSQVFGGVACASYYFFFLFFFRQFKSFYQKPMMLSVAMCLGIICLVVEFWWYSNIRFWAGGYFLAGMYMKYVNTEKRRYLVLALLAPLFHFSLVTADLALILNFILNYLGKFVRFGLLVLSLFVRSLNIDFVPLLLKYVPWANENLAMGVVNKTTRKSVLSYMQSYRQEGNIVYNLRPYIILLLGLMVLGILRFAKARFDKRYSPLFFMFLTLFSVANFGYADMYFYNRFSLMSFLFLWMYVFVVMYSNAALMRRNNLLLVIILILPLIYFFITPITQFRSYILQPELFFGNFFMDWDGNALDIDYHRRLIR